LDVLIKNNIIKKNKLIVDIGMYETKVLEAHYEAKKITVISAKTIGSNGLVDENGIDFSELASRIDAGFSGSAKRDVSVSLPSEICESKIITIKNKKKSEIPKIIKREHMNFGRANPITHVVDYAFLGMREEDGDTVYYYLLSAVQKSIAAELIASFDKHRLRVKTIVSSVYNQICLSEIFYDEYEHLNRLFVDFGTNTTRITAFSEGMAVYTRSMDVGFNTYVKSLFTAQEDAGKPEIIEALTNVGEYTELAENIIGKYFSELNIDTYKSCVNEVDNYTINDISRVIDLCSKNDLAVSKIYYTGNVINGFAEKLCERLDVAVEKVMFHSLDEKDGKGYVLEIDDIDFSQNYINALGLCIYPML